MSRKLLILLLLMVFFNLAAVPALAEDQIIKLKSGFNFISFTVTPPATPAEFRAKNSNIQDIYSYAPEAGTFPSHGEGTLLSLAAGKGYIVKSAADADVTISGAAVSTIGDIVMAKGFNLIGFSKNHPRAATFSQLMGTDSKIRGLYKWNVSSGTFQAVIKNPAGAAEPLNGVDPAITAGESYFINVSEASSVNYDGSATGSSKTLVSISVSPDSGEVAVGGTFDLSLVKVTALYSDGSTAQVAAVFTADNGSISATTYTAPKMKVTVFVKASYVENGVTAEAFLTLAVTDGTILPVATSVYKCSYKLSSKAKIVDEEKVVTQSMAETNLVIVDSTGILSYQTGDIFMGYKNDGYLREALSVQKLDNNTWFIQTKKTSMESAFEELDYVVKGKLSSIAMTSTAAPGSAEERAVARFLMTRMAPAPQRGIISPDKLKKILDNMSLSVALTKAEIGFDPILEFDIKISWFKLKRFLFVVGGKVTGDVEFKVEAKGAVALPINAEFNIFHSLPFVFTVGPVPFTFEWDMNCGVDAKASAIGEYTYSNKFKYVVRMGAEYTDTDSWKQIKEFTRESQSEDSFGLKGTIEIKPYFDIGFMIKVAGLAGPKISLEAFFSMLAEMSGLDRVDFSVTAGVTAKVAFVVEVFSYSLAEFSADIYTMQWELYKKTIDMSIAPPVISPPGGSYIGKQTVTITCTTENAIIKYTTDGSTPSSTSGNVYGGAFEISSSATVNAIAIKSVAGASSVSSAAYTILDAANMVKVSIAAKPAAAAVISVQTPPVSKDDIYYYYNKDTVLKFSMKLVSGYYLYSQESNYSCQEEYEIAPNGEQVPSGTFTCVLTEDLKMVRNYVRKGPNGETMRYFDIYKCVWPVAGAGSIKAVSESGQTSPDDLWIVGTKLKLTAVPASGYFFDYWQLPNVNYKDYNNPCSKLPEVGTYPDYNLAEATFAEKKKLTVTAEPSASDIADYSVSRHISNPSVIVPLAGFPYFGKNWELKYSFVPAAGNRLVRLDTAQGGLRTTFVNNTLTGTFETMITSSSDITVYPVFEPIPSNSMYTVTIGVYPAGCGTVQMYADQPAYNGKYPERTKLTLTATPAAGYRLEDFYWASGAPGVNIHSSSNPLNFELSPDSYGVLKTTGTWNVTAKFVKQ